jgi:hypothetical protein
MPHDIGLARFAERISFIPLTLQANRQNPGVKSSLAFDCNSLQYFLASGDHASVCLGYDPVLAKIPRVLPKTRTWLLGAQEKEVYTVRDAFPIPDQAVESEWEFLIICQWRKVAAWPYFWWVSLIRFQTVACSMRNRVPFLAIRTPA